MTMYDVLMFKKKFNVGDMVVVPKEIARLIRDEESSRLAEVVGKYKHFLNVRYIDTDYQQSIQYKDVGKVQRVFNKIA